VKKKRVRPIAIAVITNGDRMLVAEGYDEVKRKTFYRPLGGKIELGEHGAETIARELEEELGIEVINPRYLGALESIYDFNGKRGHEIVLVYAADLADRSLYRQEKIDHRDRDGVRFRGIWKALSDFSEGAILYPEGLLELLRDAPLEKNRAVDK
jgi:8-oxo-dGTP pyrophosphatase MutT (NUDIX family)